VSSRSSEGLLLQTPFTYLFTHTHLLNGHLSTDEDEDAAAWWCRLLPWKILICLRQSRDVLGVQGAPRAFPHYYLVFSHPSFLHLRGELPGTSQLNCFPWVSLLHGGHSWKRQHPFKDKPRDDADVNWSWVIQLTLSAVLILLSHLHDDECGEL